MEVAMIIVALGALGIAALLALYRIFRGPSVIERIIALELELIVLMTVVMIRADRSNDPSLLPLLAVIAIVGFTTTVSLARYIEARRVPQEDSP
jgi:multicomponent Na+:H+ antiporter subunit F